MDMQERFEKDVRRAIVRATVTYVALAALLCVATAKMAGIV